MAGTNVVISIALIPTYGAIGAAVGTAASYGVGQVFYVWDQHAAARRAVATGLDAGRPWGLIWAWRNYCRRRSRRAHRVGARGDGRAYWNYPEGRMR
jgi:hypothetical protein